MPPYLPKKEPHILHSLLLHVLYEQPLDQEEWTLASNNTCNNYSACGTNYLHLNILKGLQPNTCPSVINFVVCII